MAFIGNVIWFLFTGAPIFGAIYYILGFIFSITIILHPIGKVCYNLGKLMFFPFGKTIIKETDLKGSDNVNSLKKRGGLIANIIWFPFGISLFMYHFLIGLLMYIFIITIPLGKVNMRIARIILWPVGAKVVPISVAKAAEEANAKEYVESVRD